MNRPMDNSVRTQVDNYARTQADRARAQVDNYARARAQANGNVHARTQTYDHRAYGWNPCGPAETGNRRRRT
ncbi:hypothetical protein B0H19DRAFT_1143437 [Mycena capillaripes]|nr:hypothetical protein B0H19DRAFT_1143437 [Mycena capillaripes]